MDTPALHRAVPHTAAARLGKEHQNFEHERASWEASRAAIRAEADALAAERVADMKVQLDSRLEEGQARAAEDKAMLDR